MTLAGNPLFEKLYESNRRVIKAGDTVDRIYKKRGIPRDAPIVTYSGEDDELLVAMKELEAANREQNVIVSALVESSN